MDEVTGGETTAQTPGPPQNSVDGSKTTDSGAVRILYLYSGPHRPDDGLEIYAHQLGAECRYVDKEFDEEHDLLSQAFWEELTGSFAEFDDKKKVTEGTLLAVRAAEAAEDFHANDGWWIMEQPHEREGQTSMWKLDELQRLREKPDVYLYTFAQCRFGCRAEKLTDLLSNIPGLDEFMVKCNHPCQTWVIPWSGEQVWAPHPPLRGRQWAIPLSEWNDTMLRQHEPAGDYITRSCAAYPAELNRTLAKALCRKRGQQRTSAVRKEAEKMSVEDPKVVKMLPLRGHEPAEQDPGECNSLRDVHKWVTDKAKYIGVQVKNLVYRSFDKNPEIETEILKSLGHSTNGTILDAAWMNDLRSEVADLLVRNRLHTMPDRCDTMPIDTEYYRTCIRGRLLHYWSEIVADPGERCTRWTYEGAPAGLEQDTSELDGMFQQVDADEAELESVEELFTDYDVFQNYAGVEEDEEAFSTLESYQQKGFLTKFDNLDEVREFVGGEPVLSKLGCIKKAKLNMDTGEMNYKTRIILDCKRSQVSKIARRTHKAVLPRVSDAVHSLLASMSSGDNVTMLVADVTDAFWLIPLHFSERKYFVARLREKYYVFTRTAQGSRGAPLTFAAVLSVAARWVASADPTMKLQVYVDDPLAILRGSVQEQQRLACLVVTMWSIMGFPIATHKAVLSQALIWIGVKLHIQESQVVAEVPASKVQELDKLLEEAMQSNVISKKSLRTLIGKAMAIASVLFVWRPFISELYVALHADQSQAPRGCVWTKQIAHSVHWLRVFLSGEKAGIIRCYTLEAFNNKGPEIIITWDASPYGMGGTLQVQGTYVEFFASKITEDDEIHLGTKLGSNEGQQTWEALCGLVCLRLWHNWWQSSRAKLRLRNDNMGALTLYAQVKGKSAAHTLLAREFALDLGRAQHRPRVVEHLPGVANTVCDVLSRRYQPGVVFNLPIQLKSAKAVVPPPRPRTWWRTLSWGAVPPAPPCADPMGHPTAPEEVNPKRRRHDFPIVRNRDSKPSNADTDLAPHQLRSALDELHADMYASSSRAPRDALLKTWTKFHQKWYGDEVSVLPITEDKLLKVSSIFKRGGYKSVKNYLSRIKEFHLMSGFEWSDRLDLISKKCARSALRGLGGAQRSEPFDLIEVIKATRSDVGPLVDGGPINPSALVVTATLFMLREVEASALEVSDLTFSGDSVSLRLPVSKVDWQAKGCTRTWHCLCDRDLPCVMHMLKAHVGLLTTTFKGAEQALFPTLAGSVCTKQSVVDTIRAAVDMSGGMSKDSSGSWRISGHTFRITGARTLCRWGLDPITIQLIGRWGSAAVLTYLSEAPLEGFHHRLGPTDTLHCVRPDRALPDRWTANELDFKVEVQGLLQEHNRLARDLNTVRDDIKNITNQMEDAEHRFEGIDATLRTTDRRTEI
eukprot:s2443_g15.t1